jgi:hypothetical protein
MSSKDGGSAFPQIDTDGSVVYSTGGMSLRDYFAAHALTGWLATYGDDARHPASVGANESDEARDRRVLTLAHVSYRLADAMLKARDQQ